MLGKAVEKRLRIITHGGQAHADEILAIALILLKEGKSLGQVEIIRTFEDKRAREFRSQDGADFVVDIGRDSDPRKNWFDHHHFPRNAKAACSFTLVARKYRVDLSAFDWAHKLAVIDSKGPRAWFRHAVGRKPCGGKEVSLVNGSADSFLVYVSTVAGRDFGKAVLMAKEWLEHAFLEEKEFKEGLARSLRIVKVHRVGDFKMAYYNQQDPRGSLSATDKLMEDDPKIVVAAMRDERGSGYSAVRMNDNPCVDFSPREDDEGCVFAHKMGFILKWEDDWEGFCDAVRRSVERKKQIWKSVPQRRKATKKK